MGPTIAEWGLYPWFEEHGRDLIHPDDFEDFRRLASNAKVFQCTACEREFVSLRYGERHFRVKPTLFKPVPKPLFDFGKRVTFKNGSNLVTGVVSDILWHYKETKHYFLVSVDGKPLKKRYWAEELWLLGEENGSNRHDRA